VLQPFFRSPLAVFIVIRIFDRFVPEHDQREAVGLQVDLFTHPRSLASALDVDPVVGETRTLEICPREFIQWDSQRKSLSRDNSVIWSLCKTSVTNGS
jgi:hypothetical protein